MDIREAFEIEAEKLGLDLTMKAGYRADPETGNIERGFYRGYQAALSHIGDGSKAEPVAVLYKNGTVLTKEDCGDVFEVCCRVETPLYTHPAPTAQDSDHWAVNNPGRADQYKQEAMAARSALGFASDADDVAPADILREINKLTTQDSKVPEEGWKFYAAQLENVIDWMRQNPCGQPKMPKAPAPSIADKPQPSAISEFFDMAEELENTYPFLYVEIARTRVTDWMAWFKDKPGDAGSVLSLGQGSTPEEACRDALAQLQPPQD